MRFIPAFLCLGSLLTLSACTASMSSSDVVAQDVVARDDDAQGAYPACSIPLDPEPAGQACPTPGRQSSCATWEFLRTCTCTSCPGGALVWACYSSGPGAGPTGGCPDAAAD